MPVVKDLADHLTVTLSTFEKNKYDLVGLAQKYPDYEVMKQQIQGRRVHRDMSHEYTTELRIDKPSSYEQTYVNHPLQTGTDKLFRDVKSSMTESRVSTTFNNKERVFQGASTEKIIDIIQARLVAMDQDYWEGLEEEFFTFDGAAFPPKLNGVTAWVTNSSTITDFDPNGGDDPSGISGGIGGITAAQEPKWPNAYGEFAAISQDDFFDVITKFLNRAKTKHVVPHPALVSEMPNRVLYTQEPIQRAIERYLAASNQNTGKDAGAYRGSPMYGEIPITIWHVMSSPDSPVRPAKGTCMLIDWETFHYVVHSQLDRKMHGPELLPNIPGQFVVAEETAHLLHCTRRDRNLRLETDTVSLQPDSV